MRIRIHFVSKKITSGVPQRSQLGPHYYNDVNTDSSRRPHEYLTTTTWITASSTKK